jgi:hypothetical protein
MERERYCRMSRIAMGEKSMPPVYLGFNIQRIGAPRGSAMALVRLRGGVLASGDTQDSKASAITINDRMFKTWRTKGIKAKLRKI